MDTYINSQLKISALISRFIDENFYNSDRNVILSTAKRPDSFKRPELCSEDDKQGIDVYEFFEDNESSTRKIDEKATFGNTTTTFAFEIAQREIYPFSTTSKKDFKSVGWLLSPDKTNNYYRVAYVNSLGGKRNKKLEYEDIVSLEFYTFSKEALIKFLAQYGINFNELYNIAEQCYENFIKHPLNEQELQHTFNLFPQTKLPNGKDGMYIVVSEIYCDNKGDKKAENIKYSCPVNLIMRREFIEKIENVEYCAIAKKP